MGSRLHWTLTSDKYISLHNIIFTKGHLPLYKTRAPANNECKSRIPRMISKRTIHFPDPTLRSTLRARSSSSSWPMSSRGWSRASSTSPTSRSFSATTSGEVSRPRWRRDTRIWVASPPTLARCWRHNYRWHLDTRHQIFSVYVQFSRRWENCPI